MFSKWIFIFLLISTLTSCVRTREPINETPIQLGAGEAQCLNQAGETIRIYAQGSASEQQIQEMWNCVSLSVKLFQKRVKPTHAEYYTPNELKNFLNYYFLSSKPLTEEFLDEVMALKVTLVGGVSSRIYHHELNYLRNLMTVFSRIMLRLRPYMPYTFTRIQQLTEDELDLAMSGLIIGAQELGQALEEAGQQYTLDHLSELLRVVMGELGSSAKKSGSKKNLNRDTEFLKSLKLVLFPHYPDRVSGNEWVSVLETSARWYSAALRFSYLNKNYKSWSYGSGLTHYHQFLLDILTLVREALGRNKDSTVSFETLFELIDTTPDSLMSIDRRALKDFLVPLIKKILRQGERRAGLSDLALTDLSQSVDDWYQGQLYLIQLFQLIEKKSGDHNADGYGYSKEKLLSVPLAEVLGVAPQLIRESSERLFNLYRSPKFLPLFYGEEDEITFPLDTDPKSGRFSLNDLSKINALNILSRKFLTSYADLNGATLEAFRQFYSDTKDIGIELKFYDPESKNPADKRFREGNLFTDASDGDALINETEATQLSSLLISARRAANKIHQKIVDECNKVRKVSNFKNHFDQYYVRAECYREVLFKNFDQYFSKMPLLVQHYLSKKTAGQSKEFEVALEQSTGRELAPNPSLAADEWMSSQDTDLILGVSQYVENIFRRFDVNHDQVLSRVETEKAFSETYKNIMIKILQLETKKDEVDEKDALATFLVFLKQGSKPTWADIAIWKLKEKLGRQEVRADRTTLFKIFAELAKIFQK